MSDSSRYSMSLTRQFKRLLNVLKLIDKSPGEWGAAGLAVKLEVSEPTINRDIRLLRTLGKITKERGRGYVLEELCFSPSKLTLPEVLALSLAVQGLTRQGDTPFARAARSALRKVCGLQPRQVKRLLDRLDESVILLPRVAQDLTEHSSVLAELQEAVLRRLTIRMDYAADHSGPLTSRRVDPYTLHFTNDTWYVTGHCHLREAIRTFQVARIRRLDVVEGAPFERPTDFDTEAYLQRGWRVWVEDGEQHQVKLRFKPELADYVEGTRWHARQKTTRYGDGSVDFEVELSGLTEVTSWILSFGGLVEVLAPKELRERVRREAQAMARLYRRSEAGSAGV